MPINNFKKALLDCKTLGFSSMYIVKTTRKQNKNESLKKKKESDKVSHRLRENIHKIYTYLTKELHLEYINNSYSSI